MLSPALHLSDASSINRRHRSSSAPAVAHHIDPSLNREQQARLDQLLDYPYLLNGTGKLLDLRLLVQTAIICGYPVVLRGSVVRFIRMGAPLIKDLNDLDLTLNGVIDREKFLRVLMSQKSGGKIEEGYNYLAFRFLSVPAVDLSQSELRDERSCVGSDDAPVIWIEPCGGIKLLVLPPYQRDLALADQSNGSFHIVEPEKISRGARAVAKKLTEGRIPKGSLQGLIPSRVGSLTEYAANHTSSPVAQLLFALNELELDQDNQRLLEEIEDLCGVLFKRYRKGKELLEICQLLLFLHYAPQSEWVDLENWPGESRRRRMKLGDRCYLYTHMDLPSLAERCFRHWDDELVQLVLTRLQQEGMMEGVSLADCLDSLADLWSKTPDQSPLWRKMLECSPKKWHWKFSQSVIQQLSRSELTRIARIWPEWGLTEEVVLDRKITLKELRHRVMKKRLEHLRVGRWGEEAFWNEGLWEQNPESVEIVSSLSLQSAFAGRVSYEPAIRLLGSFTKLLGRGMRHQLAWERRYGLNEAAPPLLKWFQIGLKKGYFSPEEATHHLGEKLSHAVDLYAFFRDEAPRWMEFPYLQDIVAGAARRAWERSETKSAELVLLLAPFWDELEELVPLAATPPEGWTWKQNLYVAHLPPRGVVVLNQIWPQLELDATAAEKEREEMLRERFLQNNALPQWAVRTSPREWNWGRWQQLLSWQRGQIEAMMLFWPNISFPDFRPEACSQAEGVRVHMFLKMVLPLSEQRLPDGALDDPNWRHYLAQEPELIRLLTRLSLQEGFIESMRQNRRQIDNWSLLLEPFPTLFSGHVRDQIALQLRFNKAGALPKELLENEIEKLGGLLTTDLSSGLDTRAIRWLLDSPNRERFLVRLKALQAVAPLLGYRGHLFDALWNELNYPGAELATAQRLLHEKLRNDPFWREQALSLGSQLEDEEAKAWLLSLVTDREGCSTLYHRYLGQLRAQLTDKRFCQQLTKQLLQRLKESDLSHLEAGQIIILLMWQHGSPREAGKGWREALGTWLRTLYSKNQVTFLNRSENCCQQLLQLLNSHLPLLPDGESGRVIEEVLRRLPRWEMALDFTKASLTGLLRFWVTLDEAERRRLLPEELEKRLPPLTVTLQDYSQLKLLLPHLSLTVQQPRILSKEWLIEAFTALSREEITTLLGRMTPHTWTHLLDQLIENEEGCKFLQELPEWGFISELPDDSLKKLLAFWVTLEKEKASRLLPDALLQKRIHSKRLLSISIDDYPLFASRIDPASLNLSSNKNFSQEKLLASLHLLTDAGRKHLLIALCTIFDPTPPDPLLQKLAAMEGWLPLIRDVSCDSTVETVRIVAREALIDALEKKSQFQINAEKELLQPIRDDLLIETDLKRQNSDRIRCLLYQFVSVLHWLNQQKDQQCALLPCVLMLLPAQLLNDHYLERLFGEIDSFCSTQKSLGARLDAVELLTGQLRAAVEKKEFWRGGQGRFSPLAQQLLQLLKSLDKKEIFRPRYFPIWESFINLFQIVEGALSTKSVVIVMEAAKERADLLESSIAFILGSDTLRGTKRSLIGKCIMALLQRSNHETFQIERRMERVLQCGIPVDKTGAPYPTWLITTALVSALGYAQNHPSVGARSALISIFQAIYRHLPTHSLYDLNELNGPIALTLEQTAWLAIDQADREAGSVGAEWFAVALPAVVVLVKTIQQEASLSAAFFVDSLRSRLVSHLQRLTIMQWLQLGRWSGGDYLSQFALMVRIPSSCTVDLLEQFVKVEKEIGDSAVSMAIILTLQCYPVYGTLDFKMTGEEVVRAVRAVNQIYSGLLEQESSVDQEARQRQLLLSMMAIPAFWSREPGALDELVRLAKLHQPRLQHLEEELQSEGITGIETFLPPFRQLDRKISTPGTKFTDDEVEITVWLAAILVNLATNTKGAFFYTIARLDGSSNELQLDVAKNQSTTIQLSQAIFCLQKRGHEVKGEAVHRALETIQKKMEKLDVWGRGNSSK